MSEIVIFTQEEYEKLREQYIQEHLFETDLKPFFQTRLSVVKDYIYYDEPVKIY